MPRIDEMNDIMFYFSGNHPISCNDPDDTVVWRYLKKDKFDDLLNSSSIYFRRACKLSDPEEGKLNEVTYGAILDAGGNPDIGNHNERLIRDFNEIHRQTTYVNCWFKNDNLTNYMWKTYANLPGDIAIKSTIGKLKRAFAPPPLNPNFRKDWSIYLSDILYIDREKDHINYFNLYQHIRHKDLKYLEEREVRLLFHTALINLEDDGIKVKIKDLSDLIEGILLNPSSTSLHRTNLIDQLKPFSLNQKILE